MIQLTIAQNYERKALTQAFHGVPRVLYAQILLKISRHPSNVKFASNAFDTVIMVLKDTIVA